jgi:hypothetical protein
MCSEEIEEKLETSKSDCVSAPATDYRPSVFICITTYRISIFMHIAIKIARAPSKDELCMPRCLALHVSVSAYLSVLRCMSLSLHVSLSCAVCPCLCMSLIALHMSLSLSVSAYADVF